ncbi:MAG TPA: M14 family metallopeptidase [Candidatus Solibacter sp.]|nr:M14 family metallopeptidase [Candidatus Solibacter sp.]
MNLRIAGAGLGLALAIAGSSPVARAQISYRVGTAEALRGQRANGYIEVPKGSDWAIGIPVIVFHGARPGPVLALVAGAHGTEYASIIALERVATILDPSQLAGTVVIVPLLNTASFEQKVPHLNPVDGKNMNRFYPGNAEGTQTERAALVITKEIVERSTYLIDYHGGDLDESLRPYTYWGPTGHAEQDRISKEMALAFGLNHIIIWRDRPADPAATKYLDNTAASRGKPSIVVEAGHAGTVESDDVNLLVTGTISTMRTLKMLEGPPLPIENPVWLEKTVDVTSEKTGIFYPLVLRSGYVAVGEKLGYVTDYFGNTIFVARAPVAGIVMHICSVPSMKQGDNIAVIGVPAEKAP